MSKNVKIRIEKPKTKRGERVLKEREPQQVEEVKKILLLYGNKPSQVVKEVFTDIHSLERRHSIKYTRKNDDLLPFENGGEVKLEHFSKKTDCGQFVLGTHSKKRPHNLVLGRFYDHRLYDLLELGVDSFKSLKSFGAASSSVQSENKPCFIFSGEQFEQDAEFKQAKSALLDLFRGRVVEGLNLVGLDHVILCMAYKRIILFRQYAIKLKKSGTKIPRIELTEMGPSMDLSLRRVRSPDSELQKQASQQQSKPTKKKEKNVSSSLLEGRVGRIYMPKQQIEAMPRRKVKALKRDSSEDGKRVPPSQVKRAKKSP